VKALALGANAVLLGRASLYGLGAAGEAGVDYVLRLLRDEVNRTLAQIGCPAASQLSSDYVMVDGSMPTTAPRRSATIRFRRIAIASAMLSLCDGLGEISPGWLQQLFQLFDRFGILRADWLVTAAGIRPLQRTSHRPRNPERRATVARFAYEVPLRSSWNVTVKTVPAKSIDDIDGPSFANLCSVF
jgi:hypothetical protein